MTLLLCLLLFQNETFYSFYDQGVASLQAKDYPKAIEQLEKAVALRPDSSPNARTYGVQMQRYFPYNQLAWAYLCTRDFTKADEYLQQAYEQGENKDGGETISLRMSMIDEAVANLSQTPPEGEKDLPKPKPDLAPVADLLLKGELDDALEYIVLLQSSFPNDSQLKELYDSTSQRQEEVNNELAQQKRFQDQLESLLATARQAEAGGSLETALQRYDQVLRFDEENGEASAALVRVRNLLSERGSDEASIQTLLEQKDAEKDEAVRTLQRELQASREQLQASRREAKRLSDNFDERVRDVIETRVLPNLYVKWNFTPTDSKRLLANVTPNMKCSAPMAKVKLFINNTLQDSWDVEGKKRFVPPPLVNFEFQKHANLLRIEAVDVDGNTMEDIYPYTFPRTQTLRFTRKHRTALALVIGGFIAFFIFSNQQRRRKAFRERFNPYVAGAPVLNEKMFYGRSPLLKQILNALHNNSLMVYGERRIGKTSFLHRLNNTLPHVDDPIYEFIPVFIDLQGVRESDFFATIDHEIIQVLEERGLNPEPQGEDINARRFISRLRKNIGLLKQQCTKKPKLTLLLDEVDVMNSFSEQTNQQLRSVFMKGFAEHIVAVMAGIHINTKWKSEGSPWYNFFEQIELKPFSRNQAEELINKPVNGVYAYTPDAVNRIMEITGGKPYLIQKMCLNLVSYILLNNKRKISAKDVDLVFKDIEKEFYGD